MVCAIINGLFSVLSAFAAYCVRGCSVYFISILYHRGAIKIKAVFLHPFESGRLDGSQMYIVGKSHAQAVDELRPLIILSGPSLAAR